MTTTAATASLVMFCPTVWEFGLDANKTRNFGMEYNNQFRFLLF